jgi:ArsR family transcriptional regulator
VASDETGDPADTRGVNPSKTLERSSAERARRFAALGDPVRVEILDRLGRGTRCLCELEDDLGLAPNLLSYHMRILREAGLVSGERRGRRVDYRIEPDGVEVLRADLDRLTGAWSV